MGALQAQLLDGDTCSGFFTAQKPGSVCGSEPSVLLSHTLVFPLGDPGGSGAFLHHHTPCVFPELQQSTRATEAMHSVLSESHMATPASCPKDCTTTCCPGGSQGKAGPGEPWASQVLSVPGWAVPPYGEKWLVRTLLWEV